MKKRIMIFCDSYLPGYQGGGGMRSVHNFADTFKDQYDFFVVTRDCDGKADKTPYVHAARDKWNERDEAKVYYASPSKLTRRTFSDLISEVAPDLIYLNSAFSYVSVTFILTRKKFGLAHIPTIVAPCGEFAKAALDIKAQKKRTFLAFAKFYRLYERVVWKAASANERKEILATMGNDIEVAIAPELLPHELLPGLCVGDKTRQNQR